MKTIPCIKFWQQPPATGNWVADNRSFDIPETIKHFIINASRREGCVAVTLSRRGGYCMIRVAEQTAAEHGIKVIWWNGPYDKDCDW